MSATTLDLSLSSELEELRTLLRDFMTRKSPVGAARERAENGAGYDETVWHQMRDQMGLPGLALPERYGGQGFSAFEQQVVLEEMGRVLHASPYYASSVLAATALLASGDERACDAYLPGIAEGSVHATCAVSGPGTTVRVTGGGEAARLVGEARFVVDATTASVLLVVAEGDDGPGLFAVAADAPGLVREPLPTIDATRPMGRLLFEDVPARLVGRAGEGLRISDRVRTAAVAALAGEQLGGAERCLEIAVEYAQTREQFGRAIGSFQAVKHKCADMLLQVEAARSAAVYLARLLSHEDLAQPIGQSVAEGTLVAAIVCGEAYVFVAKQTIQILGGIGYTWEHDAHLYLKRAKAAQLLAGSPLRLRAEFAALTAAAKAGDR